MGHYDRIYDMYEERDAQKQKTLVKKDENRLLVEINSALQLAIKQGDTNNISKYSKMLDELVTS